VKPARERELHVECINAFYNWQEFLQPLQISLSGLAILEHEQEVNFSFRMVTRRDIKQYQGFEKWLAMTDRQDIVQLVFNNGLLPLFCRTECFDSLVLSFHRSAQCTTTMLCNFVLGFGS
jgi:hypothetical protein